MEVIFAQKKTYNFSEVLLEFLPGSGHEKRYYLVPFLSVLVQCMLTIATKEQEKKNHEGFCIIGCVLC